MTRLRLAWKILTGANLVSTLAAMKKACEGCDGRDYVVRELRKLLDEERILRVRADDRLIDSMRPRPFFPPQPTPEEQASVPFAIPGGF